MHGLRGATLPGSAIPNQPRQLLSTPASSHPSIHSRPVLAMVLIRLPQPCMLNTQTTLRQENDEAWGRGQAGR